MYRRVVAEHDHFRAFEAHDAKGFGPTTVVAQAHADLSVEFREDTKAQVAMLKIAFFQMLKGSPGFVFVMTR